MLKTCGFIKEVELKYDDEHAVIVIGNSLLRFTRNEYKLLYILLNHEKVSDNDLNIVLYNRQINEDDKRTIKKYIYNIRCQLKPHKITISRIYNYGYTLQYIESEE